jgi:hypothetical protein
MKNILLLLVITSVFSTTLYAQESKQKRIKKVSPPLPRKSIQFLIGHSTHGTGDLTGISFGAEYSYFLKKNISIDMGFKGTIHDGADIYTYTSPGGSGTSDGSLRVTTAGFQVHALGRYSFFRTNKHDFSFGAGPVVRYQSGNLGSNGYTVRAISVPPGTVPAFTFDHRVAQRELTVGFLAGFRYSYTFQKGILLGIEPSFQNDTNGDAITHISLIVGKRF